MKNFFPVFILSFLVSIIGCGGSPDPDPDPGDPDTSSQPAIVVEINSVAINNQYSFDFGSSTFDNSIQADVSIKNTGTGELQIHGIELSGEGAAAFSLDKSAMAAAVPGGESTTFKLLFSPKSPDQFSASVSILSNSTKHKNFIIYAQGEGKCLEGDNFLNLDQVYSAGSYFTRGTAMKSFVSGNYAYVADFQDGLKVIDVSNKHYPVLAGSYNSSGEAVNVYVSGSYAYVAGGSSRTVLIYSISDPANLSLVGELSHETEANQVYGIFVKDNRAYVSTGDEDGAGNLFIWNISDPVNPEMLGKFTCSNSIYSVYVDGSFAYLAELNKGLRVVNISNPYSPQSIGVLDTNGTSWSVTADNNYIYVADGTSGLKILRYNGSGMNLEKAGEFCLEGSDSYEVTVLGNIAYVADNNHGLMIVDISNPAVPELIKSYQTEGTAAGVYVSDNIAYVSDEEGLSLIYTGDMNIPRSTANPAHNSVNTDTAVTLSSNESASVYYTLDGSVPTTCSAKYTFPIIVNEDITIRYFAVDYAGNRESEKSISYIIDDTAPVTSPSVDEGLYNEAVTLALLANEPAVIYYTLNGSTPTTGSSIYSSPITISDPGAVLKYFAVDTAGNREAVKSGHYNIDTILPSVNANASPSGGTYWEDITVTLSASEPAVIYYTLDGSEPSSASLVYDSPFLITDPGATLKCMAVDTAGNQGATLTREYIVDTTPPVTTASPEAGIVAETFTVTLSASETAIIYYSINGSDPGGVYTTPLEINLTPQYPEITVKFFAVDHVGNREAVQEVQYVCEQFSPPVVTASPPGGTYGDSVTITLTSDKPAKIYYTTNGSDPVPENSSPYPWGGSTREYSQPLTFTWDGTYWDWSGTLKFIAVGENGQMSEIKAETYSVVEAFALTPYFEQTNTHYAISEIAVEIKTDTSGASIKYTLDGSDPITSDTALVYTGKVVISSDTLIRAHAFREGLENSGVAEMNYTFGDDFSQVFSSDEDTYFEKTSIMDQDNKLLIALQDRNNDNKFRVLKWENDMEWTDLGTANKGAAGGGSACMVIDPSDNKPVVSYYSATGVYIRKWESGTTWTDMGSINDGGSLTNFSLILDPSDNKPIISFRDSSNDNQRSILKWESGTTWLNLGFTEKTDFRYLWIDPSDNKLLVFYSDTVDSILKLLKWEGGTNWSNPGNITTVPTGYTKIFSDPLDNSPVVVFLDKENSEFKAIKWEDGSTWTDLGVIMPGLYQLDSYYRLYFDPIDHKPVIAFKDYSDKSVYGNWYRIHLKKWDSYTSWTDMGFAPVNSKSLRSLYVDSESNCIMSFQMPSSGYPFQVLKRYSESDWDYLGFITTEWASGYSVDQHIAPDGKLIIVCSDEGFIRILKLK